MHGAPSLLSTRRPDQELVPADGQAGPESVSGRSIGRRQAALFGPSARPRIPGIGTHAATSLGGAWNSHQRHITNERHGGTESAFRRHIGSREDRLLPPLAGP